MQCVLPNGESTTCVVAPLNWAMTQIYALFNK
jgi:hypothetical protein